jgi:hypothetical protein
MEPGVSKTEPGVSTVILYQGGIYAPGKEKVVPNSDGEFDSWAHNLCDLTVLRTGVSPAEWDYIPPAAVATLTTANAAWHTTHAVTLKAHTPIDTEAKNRARGTMEKEARSFINEYIRNSSKVSPEDKLAVGVHERAKQHHIVPPHTVPVLEARAGNPRQIEVFYWDAVKGGRGKPEGVHGIEVLWAILDHEPTSVEELIHSAFDTRIPLILTFDEADRGKRVYMVGYWEIEREGEKGPWERLSRRLCRNPPSMAAPEKSGAVFFVMARTSMIKSV